MRDDVKDIFNNLLKHLESKKLLLNSILQKEKTASDLIKNRNDAEDEILKIIESESELIEEIDVEDFNISRIKDELFRKYKLDFNKVLHDKHFSKDQVIIKLNREFSLLDETLNEIINLKKQNNTRMDSNQKDLELQISELERMDRLILKLPKDLQSS